jgi:hypothetical protein
MMNLLYRLLADARLSGDRLEVVRNPRSRFRGTSPTSVIRSARWDGRPGRELIGPPAPAVHRFLASALGPSELLLAIFMGAYAVIFVAEIAYHAVSRDPEPQAA